MRATNLTLSVDQISAIHEKIVKPFNASTGKDATYLNFIGDFVAKFKESDFKAANDPQTTAEVIKSLRRELDLPADTLSGKLSDMLNTQWNSLKENITSIKASFSKDTSEPKQPISEAAVANVEAKINDFVKNAIKVNPEYEGFTPDKASIRKALEFSSPGDSETVKAHNGKGGTIDFKMSKDNLEKIAEGNSSKLSGTANTNSPKPYASASGSSFER